MAGIFDNLPGYLKVPTPADTSFEAWMKRITPTASKPGAWESFNYWGNTPKFAVSFLKALYGDAATKQNDWAFDYLPKVDRNYSWTHIWDNMYNGIVKGSVRLRHERRGHRPRLPRKILTRSRKPIGWWSAKSIRTKPANSGSSPGITTEEMKQHPDHCLPSALRRFRGKRRHLHQFRALAAVEKCGAAHARRLPSRSSHPRANFPEGPRTLQERSRKIPRSDFESHWTYTDPSNPSLAEVLKEINGKALCRRRRSRNQAADSKLGQQLPGFALLKDDGTTSCGNWIYSGSYTEAGNLDRPPRRRPILPASAFTKIGAGPGPPIAACYTTAPPAISTASRGILPPTSLVERSRSKVGRQRCPRLQSRFQSQGSHGPVHHEPRGRRPHLRAPRRIRRRPLPRTLRAHRKAPSRIRCIRGKPTILSSSASRRPTTNTAPSQTASHVSAPPIALPSTIIIGPRTIR